MEQLMTLEATALDTLSINTIRTLAIDMIQQAGSGHPGTPMGAAPTAYCLWQRFLRYDPQAPAWPNRDRFVLSNGHASAMLYALIHLAGIVGDGPAYPEPGRPAVTLDDIKTFRQAGSRCPGHPEHGWTTGVEATTGPLGQGVANSVGMAVAERWLAAAYNRPGYDLFDYRVYALCGDGCMMEGVASEAASLAGHLRLGNLCWIYDRNQVTIEGRTDIAFTEDVTIRFQAYGWHVAHVPDANDLVALSRALHLAGEIRDRPTLIVVESHIGYGAPHVQDTPQAHGEPLGALEARLAKRSYGWDPDAQFLVPEAVPAHVAAQMGQRGAALRGRWETLFAAYRERYPDLAGQLDQMWLGGLPDGWDTALPTFAPDSQGLSTRDASGRALNAAAARIPWLLGGAADLATSTKTHLGFAGAGELEPPEHGGSDAGRNMHFGIREHAMAAAANGMALSGLRPFASSFLVFSDYCRPSVRLSALMGQPVLYIWTHDSISMGEDGPTHQPVEHLASLRAMPGMVVLRPADANEVSEAYRVALSLRDRPVSLVLSRQALPVLDRERYAPAVGLARGAYVLADAPGGAPEVLLLASGSEVALCVAAYEQLRAAGVPARVVSMPSWELFEAQDLAYRDSVIPPDVAARVAVEEAAAFGWERYAGPRGVIIGMRTFGMSAPLRAVQEHFGFTAEHVAAAARRLVGA